MLGGKILALLKERLTEKCLTLGFAVTDFLFLFLISPWLGVQYFGGVPANLHSFYLLRIFKS